MHLSIKWKNRDLTDVAADVFFRSFVVLSVLHGKFFDKVITS